MLIKLKLSRKLPKDILYIRHSILGIGLITPETPVANTILQLYFRNMRMKSNIVEMIIVNEEYNAVENGLNKIKHQTEPIRY